MHRGVIAAGHPLTAEAGASVLREGGNAIDAAVCAVLTSFAAESPLTGLGAGGFMLVHRGGEDVLLDFFVAAPGLGGAEGRGALVPLDVSFGDVKQRFNVGPASCGVPGTPAGLAEALRRFGTMPLAELVKPAVDLARDGVPVNNELAYLFTVLEAILTSTPEVSALYAPEGRLLRKGDHFRFPELGDALERYAAEGPDVFYTGEIGQAISGWLTERGGVVGPEDLAAYRTIERAPAEAEFRGRRVLTNPPPSSGGILIALALALLERRDAGGVEAMVEVMEEANRARGEDFHAGLYEDDYMKRFLTSRLGSTTHISVLDSDGTCASVTCSNGCSSGVLVPGTGVHLNNMLGEQDLHPLGFHLTAPGERITSMMAPTLVLRDGDVELALGSAGSNRLRSAILQTITLVIDDGLSVEEAVRAGRVHFEDGVVQAEPGVDEEALVRLEQRGYPVTRWRAPNLFFGGVQAVARDPVTDVLSGAGDPRRGGATVVV